MPPLTWGDSGAHVKLLTDFVGGTSKATRPVVLCVGAKEKDDWAKSSGPARVFDWIQKEHSDWTVVLAPHPNGAKGRGKASSGLQAALKAAVIDAFVNDAAAEGESTPVA